MRTPIWLGPREIATIMRKDIPQLIGALTDPLFDLIDSDRGCFFSRESRDKVRRLIDQQLPTVFKIKDTLSYKSGNVRVDVWDIGHKDVVFILTTARRGGLVALFDDKHDTMKQYQESLVRDRQRDDMKTLRTRAVDILKQNGYGDKDLLALGWEM